MTNIDIQSFKALSHLFRAHPWHGIPIGQQAPAVLNGFIEIVPTDTVKYEIDKASGHLRIDRPQKYSSQCPMPYGFVPQTLCGKRVGEHCSARTHTPDIMGDGDPIDICVITEKQVAHGAIVVRAVPIGGIRMIDRNQADDKIISVLYEDGVYGHWRDIYECPKNLVERLRHYFLTYKDIPGRERNIGSAEVYGADEARAVIEASRVDYREKYGELEQMLSAMMEP